MYWLISTFLLLMVKSALAIPIRPSLKQNALLPPDHLDAVKMEQDAHMNRDYKREVFFGEDHELIRPSKPSEVQKVLKELFRKVDADNNGKLSLVEISNWIEKKIKEHMDAAVKENSNLFKTLDADHDGLISWREFIIELMIALGHNRTLARRYPDDYSLIPLGEDDTIAMSKNRFRWSQADANEDNALNRTEFLAYRHPELSEPTLARMADDLITNLDEDKDGMLTVKEFARIPKDPAADLPPGVAGDDEKWQKARIAEFKEKIDANGDGVATREEMMRYVDPRSGDNALREARNLISAADHDRDGHVSLSEILENHDLILGSALFNTRNVLHEEL